MSALMGGETFSIDSKGRVKLPSRLLKHLAAESDTTFVLTRGLDGCVFGYPLSEWVQVENKIRSLNQFDQKNRSFVRHFLMLSEEVSLDGQQRIIIPRKLMEFAGIKNEVTIVGVLDHIEFWNPDKYDNYIGLHDAEFDKISEEVMTKN